MVWHATKQHFLLLQYFIFDVLRKIHNTEKKSFPENKNKKQIQVPVSYLLHFKKVPAPVPVLQILYRQVK